MTPNFRVRVQNHLSWKKRKFWTLNLLQQFWVWLEPLKKNVQRGVCLLSNLTRYKTFGPYNMYPFSHSSCIDGWEVLQRVWGKGSRPTVQVGRVDLYRAMEARVVEP